MKRRILFSLIGMVIIFGWQFLSYAMPAFHYKAQTFTPAQADILDKLKEIGLNDGMYLLGQPDPSLSRAEQEAMMSSLDGQPWAVLNYHQRNSYDMLMPMLTNLLLSLVISFVLFWLYLQQKNPTLLNRLLISLAVGMIGFLFVPLTRYIWYWEPDIWAHLLDATIPWLILGFIGHKMAVTKS